MFLKRLTMLGFKSFAERQEIEFSNGVTVLAGPNGCGKSNIVDAIKWVLGAHSPKELRVEKMEDVIFNGTETRRASNAAEVALIFSNETGILPLDTPEVEIKRRLCRSGKSEYFINSTQVQLKDLRELFWDTGIGKTAYWVMEQAKIDQILYSKPEERRYLFEEVAGITRFKERGAEAKRNLAKTAENMRQIELILSEIKHSLDSHHMTPKEFVETKERYDSLSNQMADLKEANKDLEDLTSEIQHEASKMFRSTYNRIKKNFRNIFYRLFDGGRAELRLSDTTNVLESNIEIFAKPPGKKLEHITLLSDDERFMTAVSLLFAIYAVRPSPFCLLDEIIDAALNKANENSFVRLLQELSQISQFVIITHNKNIIVAADTLLHVRMIEPGVTNIIQVTYQGSKD